MNSLRNVQDVLFQFICGISGSLLAILVGTNGSLFMVYVLKRISWHEMTLTSFWILTTLLCVIFYSILVAALQALSQQFEEGPAPTIREDMIIGYWLFIGLNMVSFLLLGGLYITMGWEFLWDFFTTAFPFLEVPVR